MGFAHNDVKLENIVVGHEDSERVYLIDFGLSTPYLTEKGEHIPKTYLRSFSGNFLFASMNQSRGNSTSRRDDIEAALLILVYLLNDSKLPWSDFSTRYKGRNFGFC